MSDFEAFEVTEEDIVGRKRKRQSKEEALYGVFYEEKEPDEALEAHKEVTFTTGLPLESGTDRSLPSSKPPSEETRLEAKALEEMYGKGFKMLQKAGFKVGQGLGKNEQGAVAPLQVQVRRKNEGLHIDKGKGGGKETRLVGDRQRWKKDYSRPEGAGREVGDLDRLLKEYRAEPDGEEVCGRPRPANETQSNALSLEDGWKMCRQEVIETERQIRHQRDVLVSVVYETVQTKGTVSVLIRKLSQLDDLSNYVSDRLDVALDLTALLQVFQTIGRRFGVLWEELDALRRVALPMAVKRFTAVWQNWSVGGDYLALKSDAHQWAQWLGNSASPLFIEWERSMQRFIQTKWRAREETGAFIDAVEAWKEVVPVDVMDRVCGCLVDVLRLEVDKWEPTKEKIPIHTWLHPWLGLLTLDELWPTLLSKLARALQPWQAADESAFVVLSPWKPVVGKLWEPFCLRHILPKLAHALTQIEINPRQQDISVFLRIMDWAEVIPEKQFSEILQADFYPNWRHTLETWLAHIEEDSLEEVQVWYEGWQSLVPKRLLDFSEAFHSG